jgi:hypothetical protein
MDTRPQWRAADAIAAAVVGLLTVVLVGTLEFALFAHRPVSPPPAAPYEEPFP